MSCKPRFPRATAIAATVILIGTLSGCEEGLAPGESGYVDPAPIGNDVDDPATLDNVPIETAIDVTSGHAFRVLVDGAEVATPVNPNAVTGAVTTQYVHPELVDPDRIVVEVLTVDGWQPTTLGAAYSYSSGSAYTNPDGSYREYYGMQVLGDGRIVRNTSDYATVDEIPRAEIEKLRIGWTASATLASRSLTVYVDHRTQYEATLTFGSWSVTLPAEFAGSISPPVLESTTSMDVSLNGSYLGTISLPAYDPNQYWASPQWFIDTTWSRRYVCHLAHYTEFAGFGAPDEQYTPLNGSALYSLPFTIDYFLQPAPGVVDAYIGSGTVTKGILVDEAAYVPPPVTYVPGYVPYIPYVPPYVPPVYTPSY